VSVGSGLRWSGEAEVFAQALTPRQRDVAALIALGLTNREIASRLMVAERTAEGHVQSILNRLGFYSRARIAAWAVGCRLLPGGREP
jgi:non-specific serine/threonine protein kinase